MQMFPILAVQYCITNPLQRSNFEIRREVTRDRWRISGEFPLSLRLIPCFARAGHKICFINLYNLNLNLISLPLQDSNAKAMHVLCLRDNRVFAQPVFA